MYVTFYLLYLKPSTQMCFESLVEDVQVVLEKEKNKYRQSIFVISLWLKAWTFIGANLNPLYPNMLCANFGWYCTGASGEEDLTFCHYILIILYPFGNGRCPFFLTNLRPLPLTQGWFVPCLFETGPLIFEKKIKMWKVYRQMDGWRTTGFH